jgi:predicted DNA-binding mobile mystery protein A
LSRAKTAAEGRKSLETVLAAYREVRGGRPQKGWIRAVRNALGLTAQQLADRMGVSQPTVQRLESSETRDAIQLSSLRKAAAALDCRLVYALVPREGLDEVYREAALAFIRSQVGEVPGGSGGVEDGIQRFIDEELDPRAVWAFVDAALARA